MDATAYIDESIKNPNAYVVPGYPAGVMPQNFAQILTPDDIKNLEVFLEAQK